MTGALTFIYIYFSTGVIAILQVSHDEAFVDPMKYLKGFGASEIMSLWVRAEVARSLEPVSIEFLKSKVLISITFFYDVSCHDTCVRLERR